MVALHHGSTLSSPASQSPILRRPSSSPPRPSISPCHSASVRPVAALQVSLLTACSALRSTFIAVSASMPEREDEPDDRELQRVVAAVDQPELQAPSLEEVVDADARPDPAETGREARAEAQCHRRPRPEEERKHPRRDQRQHERQPEDQRHVRTFHLLLGHARLALPDLAEERGRVPEPAERESGDGGCDDGEVIHFRHVDLPRMIDVSPACPCRRAPVLEKSNPPEIRLPGRFSQRMTTLCGSGRVWRTSSAGDSPLKDWNSLIRCDWS